MKKKGVYKIEQIDTIEKVSKILGKSPSDEIVMEFINKEFDLDDDYQNNKAADIISYYHVDIDNPKYFDKDGYILKTQKYSTGGKVMTKQELQSKRDTVSKALANPSIDDAKRKIFEGTLTKIDAQLEEFKESPKVDSEEWMEELEELLSEGENPEATKIYNSLSKEKKDKYLDFRHDRLTDFSASGDWEDGVAPTKEEVKKDLLYLIKLGQEEKKETSKSKGYTPSKEECEEIIKEASLKAKKAKVSAAKSAKKSPVVKNKEKIEMVEESVMERVESGKATKAEIISMIAKLAAVLKKLNKALSELK